MVKARKQKYNEGARKRKGFSLAEVLVVVAIIAILVGLSMISINRYRRSLRLLENDGAAKEIFVAAQNNLTMAFGQGYLGVSNFGTQDIRGEDVTAADDVYYFIVGPDYNYKTSIRAESVLDLMLPVGVLDSTVLFGGNMIIRYQRSTGTLLDVFYASVSAGSFPYTFDAATDYEKLIYSTEGNYKNSSKLRQNYCDAVIGYCGNESGIGKSADQINLGAPVVRGVNHDMLYAVVTFPDNIPEGYSAERIIYVTDNTGKTITFSINDECWVTRIASADDEPKFFTGLNSDNSLYQVSSNDGITMPGNVIVNKGAFILVLDDITVAGHHFKDLFPEFVPGTDVTIQAEIKLTDKNSVTHSAESNEVTLNTLFGTKNGNEVSVNNIRHLENLDKDVSGFGNDNNTIVVNQNSDISFTEFLEDMNDPSITQVGGKDDPSDSKTFAPIDTDYPIIYNGNDHIIEDLIVNTEGDAGFFGEISGQNSEIKDIKIVNPSITSKDGNAGALAATIIGGTSHTKVSGVSVYNMRPMGAAEDWNDSALRIHAEWNAGGLIGYAKNTDVSASCAALYVESASKNIGEMLAGTDQTQYSNAGGFIGYAESSTITGCYAGGHTQAGRYLASFAGEGRVNVTADYSCGGFAAVLKSTAVNYSYTTCSVGGRTVSYVDAGETEYINPVVAGFAAECIGSATAISHCYTVGRVIGGENAKDFVAEETDGKFTGSENYFLDDVSIGITSQDNDNRFKPVKVESNNHKLISYEASRQTATTYDKVVTVDSKGVYYFLTVNQLYENAGITNGAVKKGITDVQYGDWQLPSFTTTSIFFVNDDKLELYIQFEDVVGKNGNNLTVAITGETSGLTRTFLFDVEKAAANQVELLSRGYSAGEEITWWVKTSADDILPLKAMNVRVDESYIVITLDDLTVDGGHFADLFGSADSAFGKKGASHKLLPGENIKAYAVSGIAESNIEFASAANDITNSIYAYGIEKESGYTNNDKTGNTDGILMYVTNVRHLQNTAPDVSGVDEEKNAFVYIEEDLKWDEPFSEGVYALDGKAYSGFYGICHDEMKLFDGNGHTLENFVFAPVTESDGTVNSGLFQVLNGSEEESRIYEIKNIILLNCNSFAEGKDVSNASMLIARTEGKFTLHIDHITVVDNREGSAEGYAVSASGNTATAGGLIALLDSDNGSTITISQSSVSANVKASGTSGIAGGLIGRTAGGKLSLSTSYVGGHTVDGEYSTNAYNIDAQTDAGGFIGYAQNGAKGDVITVIQCFTTASVRGTYAGGFFGKLENTTTVNQSYAIGPVAGVKEKTSGCGAIVGYLAADNLLTIGSNGAFYLPEIYNEQSLVQSQIVSVGETTAAFQPMYFDAATGKISQDAVGTQVSVKKQENYVIITNTFDPTIKSAGKEFPFMCWSALNGQITFYGDWRLVGLDPAKMLEADFYYVLSDAEEQLRKVDSNTKPFMSGSNAEIFVPAMDSVNPAYLVTEWWIGPRNVSAFMDESGKNFDFEAYKEKAVKLQNAYNSNTGKLSIPSSYTKDNHSVIAVYVPNPEVHSITFVYDITGANNYGADNVAKVKTITAQIINKLKDASIPTCSVTGKTFIGWYTMEDGRLSDTPINFNSDIALNSNITAYAKFGTKYTVTIHYLLRKSINNVETFLSDSVKTYVTDKADTLTLSLLEDAPEAMLTAYKFISLKKGSENGTEINTEVISGRQNFLVTDTVDAEYYALFEPNNEAYELTYSIEYIFLHTAELEDGKWAYDSAKNLKIELPDKVTANSSSQFIMVNDTQTFSQYFNDMYEGDGVTPVTKGFIIQKFDFPSTSSPVLRITVARREFTISADSSSAAYIEPIPVEYGRPLQQLIIDAGTPSRAGYRFKEWQYYLRKENNPILIMDADTTMPDCDVLMRALWTPGTADYTVLFWFENANDPFYNYGGFLLLNGQTGSRVNTNSWDNFGGYSASGMAHRHTTNCFPGTSTVKMTQKSERVDCETITYWTANDKRIDTNSFNPSNVNGIADGAVKSFKYQGENTTYRCIKIGSDWYLYEGEKKAGETATCESGNAAWLTEEYTKHFTYNQAKSYIESSDGEGNETVKGDGSTILNVYFSRNKYTMTFNVEGGEYQHLHIDSCYQLSCTIVEHQHTNCSLICGLEEHVHGEECLTCGQTQDPNHTSHDETCYHKHVENCYGSCWHQHDISCYIVLGSLEQLSSEDVGKITLRLGGKNPKNNYVYKVIAQGCDDETTYYLYTNNTWYKLGESVPVECTYTGENQIVSYDEDGCEDHNTLIYESTTASFTGTPLHCAHRHDPNCINCGKITGETLDCERHVHDDSCYCMKPVHHHTDACYDCGMKTHVHDSSKPGACYSLTCQKAEANTVLDGVALKLNAKWQSNIFDYVPVEHYENYWWNADKTKIYPNYVTVLDTMPDENIIFSSYRKYRSEAKVKYYLEAISGEDGVTGEVAALGGKQFNLQKEPTVYFQSGAYLTYPEEFHDILGFTQCGYRNANSNTVQSFDVKNPRTKSFTESTKDSTDFYYSRNSYDLQLFIDNQPLPDSISVQYEASILKVLKDDYRGDPPEDDNYTFAWYLDQSGTEPITDKTVMPASNFVIYGIWTPPKKTVTFMDSEAPDSDVLRSFDVIKYTTLEGIVTDPNTNLYYGAYNFDGKLEYWYYRDGTEIKRFWPQMQITTDLVLYPKLNDGHLNSQVSVIYRNIETGERLDIVSTMQAIGSTHVAEFKLIPGFRYVGWRYGENGVLNITDTPSMSVVQDTTQNVLVMEYEREITWSYTVKYVLQLLPMESPLSGISGDTLEIELLNESFDEIGTSESRIIEFCLEGDYKNYALSYMTLDGERLDGVTYAYLTYEDMPEHTVIFYLKPDTELYSVSDLHFEYNGQDRLSEINGSTQIDANFPLPEGYTGSLSYRYSLSNDGNVVTEAIHAGSYRINGYAVFSVTHNRVTTNYLSWKSEDGSVRMIIDPKAVKLKSGSGSRKYTPSSVLTNENVQVWDEAQKKYVVAWNPTEKRFVNAFCGNDNDAFKIVFAVDSFRFDVGTSVNGFIIQLKDGMDERLNNDYMITTEFGELEVKWEYKVVYKFRYRNLVNSASYTGTPLEFTLAEESVINTDDASCQIDIKTLAQLGYSDAFRLCYNYAGRDGVLDGASFDVSPEMSKDYTGGYVSNLIVYVEPNPEKIKEVIPRTGKTCIYNKTYQEFAAEFNSDVFNEIMPDAVSEAKLYLNTTYTNAVGEIQEHVQDAGDYYATSYLVLSVKTDSGTTDFLIDADTSKSTIITVKPASVTVTSHDSTAVIDETGKITIVDSGVDIDSTLLTRDMFTAEYTRSDAFAVGHVENGNYFTVKWAAGVNPDNYSVNRIYGDLDVSWRVKVTYYLRLNNNAMAIGNDLFINYTGLTFNRTAPEYRIVTDTATVFELESNDAELTVNMLRTAAPEGCTALAISENYLYINSSEEFENDKAVISPNLNVYGEYGAAEMRVYVEPTAPAEAVAAIEGYEEYDSEYVLPSALSGLNNISSRVYNMYVYVDEDGNAVDEASLEADVEYTCYTYVIMAVTTTPTTGRTSTNNYLLDFQAETITQ